MYLLTIQQYCSSRGITDRHFRRLRKEGKVHIKPGTDYVFGTMNDIASMPDADKQVYLQLRIDSWNNQLHNAHNLYNLDNKPTESTGLIISIIEKEVRALKQMGFRIKGFDKRSLQIKVSSGRIQRKGREETKPIRNKVVAGAFNKCLQLIYNLSDKQSIKSVNDAVDRAIYYAKSDEYYWEVAACENYIYTLRRHIKKDMRATGFSDLHLYLNHYNQYRKKLAYVKGSFTDDIGFMDVFSLDDHKQDVAGALVFNPQTGKLEQKQVWSWVVVEMFTQMPLAKITKDSPFNEEDIVKLLMQTFRQYGKPNVKVIMDNGLAASERVLTFINRCGVAHEVQDAYCPTQKSPNERIYLYIKNEFDNYFENFVGSNHPVEGRHRDKQLSPEETLFLTDEYIKALDNYFAGYMIDRPRNRACKSIPPSLLDKSGRVSIRKLHDFYYTRHDKQEVTDKELRYAYMKYDRVTGFQNFFIKFKGEVYIPCTDFSLVMNDPSYKFYIAYNPNDMNIIDLYTAQDIEDRIYGEYFQKNSYICSLESLANLESHEKKARVAIYNKKINKAMKELAVNFRAKYAVNKDIANAAISDQGLIDVARDQTRQVEQIIKSHMPAEAIVHALDEAAESNGNDTVNYDDAFSPESISSMNKIDVAD